MTHNYNISALLWVRANPWPLDPTNMGGPQEQKWSRICSTSKHSLDIIVTQPLGQYQKWHFLVHLECRAAASKGRCSSYREKSLLRCRDDKFCIRPWLLCDGYAQCFDGSDEDPEVCKVCPRQIGWPRRPPEKEMRATFSCRAAIQ